MLFVIFKWGSLSNSPWHVPETEASPANMSRVVDTCTEEIHHPRETGPPEQPQGEVRRSLAQGRPSAVHQNLTRPSQTQFFIPLCLAKQTSSDPVTTSLRKSIAVSPSPLSAWCFGAAPPTQDTTKAIASSAVPAETTGCCPRRPGEDAGRPSPRWSPSGIR